MDQELEKLDNIEIQELDDQDLEDAAGGGLIGNTNCGCNGNCGCGSTENPSPSPDVILV